MAEAAVGLGLKVCVQADPRRPGRAKRAAIAALLQAEVAAPPGEAPAAEANPAATGDTAPRAWTVHRHCSQRFALLQLGVCSPDGATALA